MDNKEIWLRIDYLNKDREVRHIFTDTEFVGYELREIIKQWATDIFIYWLNIDG